MRRRQSIALPLYQNCVQNRLTLTSPQNNMPYLKHKSSDLYFESHGSGPPIVLLHGVGGNHASWFYQIEAWSTKFNLITVDARGFGNSSDVEGLGRGSFTDDLAYLLDQLSIEKTLLVAQSMGGGTAVDFTCRYPSRTAALVLADTLVWLDAPESMAHAYQQVLDDTCGLSQSERVLGTSFRQAEPALSQLYLQIASFNRYTFQTLVGKQVRYMPSALAETKVPTLFVVGEEDVLFPPHLIQQVHQMIPGSQFELIPKAGHSAYFERPGEFNRIVGHWLERNADRLSLS